VTAPEQVHEACQIEMARRILSAPFDHYWSGGEKVEFLVSDLLDALGLTGNQLLEVSAMLPGDEDDDLPAPGGERLAGNEAVP
jgi:hypothetical protein